MCGKETHLVIALIEGTKLNVCKECAKFGKIIQKPKTEEIKAKKNKRFFEAETHKTYPREKNIIKKEIIQAIVPNCAFLIKQKREKLKLKQEELAEKIAEKESLIHHLESGKFEPSIKLAEKLEKFLKIKLIEEREAIKINIEKTKSDKFTIGDFIKIKK